MLNDTQKFVLDHMTENNIGAIMVPGFGYVFPCRIRESKVVANAAAHAILMPVSDE